MSVGIIGFFQKKPISISKLASTIDRDVPFYIIHGDFPENGLPIRGNFDRIPIEALIKYISENKPLITYSGTVVLDDLFTGLKDKINENREGGLIVGVAERLIELSSLSEPLLDHFTGLNPEKSNDAVLNCVNDHEAIIESLPEDRIVAFITVKDLKPLQEGKIVTNRFADVNSSLPPTLTLPEIQDTDFVHSVWDKAKETLRNEF